MHKLQKCNSSPHGMFFLWLLRRATNTNTEERKIKCKKDSQGIFMKTPLDPRHKKRQMLIEELFKIQFHHQPISNDAKQIITYFKVIDQEIEKAAPEFPIAKINRIDLAILRLAVYELTIIKKEPPKVIIDEAIELAKEYGGETSPSFINGALGKLIVYETTTKV